MNNRLTSTAILMALIITLSAFTSLAATTAVAAATTTPTAEAATTAVAMTTATPSATPTAAATATPSVVGATPTITTITASNTNPAVNQIVTFTVNLKAGTTGLSAPITLWYTYNGGPRIDRAGTFSTTNGVYIFSGPFGHTGTYVYHADFAGDSQYAASSGSVTVTVGTKAPLATTTTITASFTNPTVGSGEAFTVSVMAGTTLVHNAKVTVTHTYPGSTTPATDGVFNTGSTGKWMFSTGTYGSMGTYVYTATFTGDGTYAASAGTVTVKVGGTPTTTTITASNTNPAVGESVTFTVWLTMHAADQLSYPVSKPVTIWHTKDGVRYEDGSHTTDNYGGYTFTQAFGSTGQRIYHAEFAGDTYGSLYLLPSSGTATGNVGTTPTTLTTTAITASNTNPTVGQYVYFEVSVKSGATVLHNAKVTVTHTYPGSTTPAVDGVFDTGSMGIATFSSEHYDSAGQRVYMASFAGDGTYAASSGTFTMNVRTITTPTTTTIEASNANPNVGQTITFRIWVDAGTTILHNAKVTVAHTYPGSTTPAVDGVFDTGSTGFATFSATYGSAGQRVYTATFAGDSNAASASTGTLTVNVGTPRTTITAISPVPANPLATEGNMMFISLKAGTTGLSEPVKVWYTKPDGTRVEFGTVNTDKDGNYAWHQPAPIKGNFVWHAEFAGDSLYDASAGTTTVSVRPYPTTLTITASTTNPTVNQIVTLTVTLKKPLYNTLLSVPIKLWYTYNGGPRIDRPGTFSTVNGVYVFSGPFGHTGTYVYHADFAGDGTYDASTGAITINVRLIPTKLTIEGDWTNIHGTLTDIDGTPIYNSPVTVTWHFQLGGGQIFATVTDENGAYNVSPNFAPKLGYFSAYYHGDSYYAPSYSTLYTPPV